MTRKFGAFAALVVIIALGVIVHGNVTEAQNRDASKVTMRSLKTAGEAIDGFIENSGTFPQLPAGPLADASELGARLEGLPTEDGWGSPIMLLANGRDYVLWSRGADARDDLDRSPGRVESYASDLVYSNGEFWNCPKGVSYIPGKDWGENPFVRIAPPTAR